MPLLLFYLYTGERYRCCFLFVPESQETFAEKLLQQETDAYVSPCWHTNVFCCRGYNRTRRQDDNTHIYFRVTRNDIEQFNLRPLIKITTRLAQITNLDYFSTEIAVTKDHKFVLIDYINDQCDMRLKSNHPDGIPDRVVIDFIERMEKKILTI